MQINPVHVYRPISCRSILILSSDIRLAFQVVSFQENLRIIGYLLVGLSLFIRLCVCPMLREFYLSGCLEIFGNIALMHKYEFSDVYIQSASLISCLSTATVARALSHTKPASAGSISSAFRPSLFHKESQECWFSDSKQASHLTKMFLDTQLSSYLEILALSVRMLSFISYSEYWSHEFQSGVSECQN
jgi:hypothetical protein